MLHLYFCFVNQVHYDDACCGAKETVILVFFAFYICLRCIYFVIGIYYLKLILLQKVTFLIINLLFRVYLSYNFCTIPCLPFNTFFMGTKPKSIKSNNCFQLQKIFRTLKDIYNIIIILMLCKLFIVKHNSGNSTSLQ